MPLVRITLIGDVLSADHKRQLATNVTDGTSPTPALADERSREVSLA
jgi:phenylpyruvate tautomerase PptA (4-oxalocrotonate tautomerase family)